MKDKIYSLLIFTVAFFNIQIAGAQNITRPSIFPPSATNMQVNSYTGNLFYSRQDVFIPGRGFDLDLTFYYNSVHDSLDMGYGYGWTHSYNMSYILDSMDVVLMRGDGREDRFADNGAGYETPIGVFDTLEQYEPNKYRLSTKFGDQYYFEDASHRRLTRMEDRYGNTLSFTYTGGQLTTITDASGRTLELAWNNGHLTQVTDDNDVPTRIWSYAYDSDGHLTQATNPMDGQVAYEYNEQHWMSLMTDENGNGTSVSYNGGGAAELIATCLSRQTITYNPDQRKAYVGETVQGVNQITSYEFDDNGRNIARQGNCCGYDVSYNYDADNNILSMTDANGQAWAYTYSGNGNLQNETDPLSCITAYTYEPQFNQVASLTDKNGQTTQYTYDNNGNLTGVQKPLGITESYGYDAFGNNTSYTDGNGHTTTYDYNSNGDLIAIHDPENYSTTFTYDNRGNKLTETDGNGHTTTYEYDLLNRLIKVTDALGGITEHTYDPRGNRLSTTDANGHTTTYEYDGLDRLITVTAPLNITSRFTYDSRGNLIRSIDPRGSATHFKYTQQNQLIEQTDPEGFTTTFAYDGNGNQTSVTGPNNNTTSHEYDAVNRLIRTMDAMGFETQYAYDCNGNLTSTTDANGNATTYAYDALNRQITVTNALDHATDYEYDGNDNLTRITDARGNATSYEYNGLNQNTRETFADGTTKEYTYDGAGNLISRKDNAGNFTYYEFDALDRLTRRDYPDANDDLFTYDAVGQMITANNQNAAITFTYDDANRVTSETLNGHTTQYSYSTNTGRRTLIYPSGRVVEEQYNTRNLLSEVKEGGAMIASFAYDPGGRLTQKDYGNGTSASYFYDPNNRITELRHDPNGFVHFRYAYDQVGNKLYEEKLHHPTHSEQYGYDATYRLTNFKVGQLVGQNIPSPNTETEYVYDALGNRVTVTTDGVVTNYTANEMNEYTEIGGVMMGYDDNGNLLNRGIWTLTYNFENQLINSSSVNLDVIYQYDPLGRMISKLDPNGTSNFHFNKFRIIEESGVNNVNTVYGSWIDDLICVVENGAKTYFHSNTIGSITALSDQSMAIIERYEYDAFGNPMRFDPFFNTSSIAENNILFTGRKFNNETGLYYLRTRFLDPDIGVFISRDIVREAEKSGYAYAENSPSNKIDPFGTSPFILFCPSITYPFSHLPFHKDRNINNRCPESIPKNRRGNSPCKEIFPCKRSLKGKACDNRCQQEYKRKRNKCAKGNDTFRDNEGSKWNYEGTPGLHGNERTFRGTGRNRGSQCTYNANGKLIDEGKYQGTFDYCPPYTDNGLIDIRNIGCHFIIDVCPHFFNSNYGDGLTTKF